ncbi:hypothetical protein [Hyalangium sp.]|uniref:hypothetical protein n=1 Tax=Hyalangium sp. TaxID=2028555 RepID=UPI002D70FA69|nr:hypothetical protein [Hyalangium sp.]HYI03071.1 hypothetical protein [Hyalangium sp.]
MKPVRVDDAPHACLPSPVPSRLAVTLPLVLLVASSIACGPMEPSSEAPEASEWTSQPQDLESDNGLSANGLSANGLSANGLSANGLSANGLSGNAFTSWFGQNPAQHDTMMRYLVRCAVPAGQVRTYTNPQTQVSYTWPGGLGLAPGWASGQPANLAEQQLITACLAAHVNKYGVSVSISVLGQTATGQYIPFTYEELAHYSRREACFFGNLFNGEGVFFGVDGPRLHSKESSVRACALTSGANACPPLIYAGRCDQLCQRVGPGGFYVACSANGVTYKPLTTRISRRDIYKCGDRVCQFTESCGRGNRSNSCEADCGRCAGDDS